MNDRVSRLPSVHLRQNVLAFALKPAILLIAVIAFYLQDLTLVFNDALNNEATSYILIIPVILTYLIYRRRKMLQATITDQSEDGPRTTRGYSIVSGILLLTTAILIYWYGSYTFTPLEYHLATLPIFTAGLILVLFNSQTLKQAIIPTAFLLFLTPPPPELFNSIGAALSVYSSEASTALLQLFNMPATLTSEYGTPAIMITRPDTTTMTFAVDVACSGLYSLIGFLVFAAFITYIVRDKPWKKLAMLSIGFPLIYFLNVLRIFTIVTIGVQIGEQTALDVFHLLGGWVLIFIGTLVLLATGDKLLKINFFSREKNTCTTCNNEDPIRTRTYCTTCGRITKFPSVKFNLKDTSKLFATIVAIVLLLWIQAPVFATTHSPAQVLTQTAIGEQGNTELFPNIPGYGLSFDYRDTDFEKTSGEDYAMIFSYVPNNASEPTVWVDLEIAATTSNLHRWEACLITWRVTHGYQPRVTELDLRDVQILENPPVIARYFGFQYLQNNQTQLVLYWYETSIFTVNETTQQKQVKLSLVTFPETPQDVPSMEAKLMPIAQAIAAYWQPVKTWATISMFISENGSELAGATTMSLVAVIVLYLLETRRLSRTSVEAYRKLGTRDQELIDAIQRLQETNAPTVDKIKGVYQKNGRDNLTTEELEQKLMELQRIGVIKHVIGNNLDEPTALWKT